MAQRIAAGRKEREIDPALVALRACVAEATDDPTISAVASKRLKDMLAFTELVDRWYAQMLKVPRPRLVALLRLGEKIVNLLLAQAARLIGGPLPTSDDTGVPMIVAITEDAASRGQIWTRVVGRRRGFPQVIDSSKRFVGATGLEEYLGFGLSMELRIAVADSALEFHSTGCVLALFWCA